MHQKLELQPRGKDSTIPECLGLHICTAYWPSSCAAILTFLLNQQIEQFIKFDINFLTPSTIKNIFYLGQTSCLILSSITRASPSITILLQFMHALFQSQSPSNRKSFSHFHITQLNNLCPSFVSNFQDSFHNIVVYGVNCSLVILSIVLKVKIFKAAES